MRRCFLLLLGTSAHFFAVLPGSLSFCLTSTWQQRGRISKRSIYSFLNDNNESGHGNWRRRSRQPSFPSSVGDYLKSLHRDNSDPLDASTAASSGSDEVWGCAGSSRFSQSLYPPPPSPSQPTMTFATQQNVITFQYDDQEMCCDETLPLWVSRMFPPSIAGERYSVESITLPRPGAINAGTTISTTTRTPPPLASVRVRNNERTWEKFFVRIMKAESRSIENDNHYLNKSGATPDGSDGEIKMIDAIDFLSDPDSPFIVRPIYGFLAPRGGASNACDENKPYSDTVDIILEWNREAYNNDIQAAAESIHMDDWWLIVGTEEEIRYYSIDFV